MDNYCLVFLSNQLPRSWKRDLSRTIDTEIAVYRDLFNDLSAEAVVDTRRRVYLSNNITNNVE